MHKTLILFILCVFNTGFLSAQIWTAYLSGNEYYPVNSENKSYYPILWYSGDEGRGVLLGGFGAGVSYEKLLDPTFSLKYQINLQRSVFYDEPFIATDENGFPFGAVIGINIHYYSTLLCLPKYHFGKWSAGLGLGGRGIFSSKTDYGGVIVQGNIRDLSVKNKAQSPVILMIPFEFSYQPWQRWIFTARAELGLSKASRLAADVSERSLVTVFEVGYRFVRDLQD